MSSANQTLSPNFGKVRKTVWDTLEIIFGRYSGVARVLMSEITESSKPWSVSCQVLGSWPFCLSMVFQLSFLFHDASFQEIPLLLRYPKWLLLFTSKNPNHIVPHLHMHWNEPVIVWDWHGQYRSQVNKLSF